MDKVTAQRLSGERALFQSRDLIIENCTFFDGESPLKESRHIEVKNCNFEWKYPLWYCKHVKVDHSYLAETARSGIWYTHDLLITDTVIDAPKTFRRASNVTLENVKINHAQETFWNCENIRLKNVYANGDYFLFNSKNIEIEDFTIDGNYIFDGGENITVRNATLNSKDSFWNCKNATVYNSKIIGEYIGWNSENITFIDCEIESLQGFCYMKNVVLKNCKLINTTLAFEYSSVDAEIVNEVDSVFNPSSGKIVAKGIKELTMDETKIDPSQTEIVITGEKGEKNV